MVARGAGHRGVAAALLACTLAMGAFVAVLPHAAERERDLVDLVEPGLPFAVGAVVLAAAAGTAFAAVLAARRRLRGALHTLAGVLAATWMLLATWVLPKLEPIKSARPLATAFARVAQPDESYGLYGLPLHAAFVFYSGRHGVHLPGRAELEAWLREPVGRRRFLVARRDQLEALGGAIPGMVELIAERDPRRGWVLLSSHPAPSLAAAAVDTIALRPGVTPVDRTLGH
jgi:hypothetical protein